MEEPEGLIRHARRRALFKEEELGETLNYGCAEIKRLIPHRGAFLLLDRITAVDRETGRALGVRSLRPDDPIFADHFPSDPVYPGVLLIEMMGQLALALSRLCSQDDPSDRAAPAVRFVRVREARFIHPAGPGDDLKILSAAIDDAGFTFVACGQVLRKEIVVATAVLEAIILEVEKIG